MKQFWVVFSFLAGVIVVLPSGASDLNKPLRMDLYDDYTQLLNSGVTPEQIYELNRQALQQIYNDQAPISQKRTYAITRPQAQTILDLVNSNPIASPINTHLYDPTGALGFCFGRALFVHLELLRRGVQKDSIKKAFAVGPMNADGIDWQFHVTTIVRGENGEWLAIDPLIGKIVRLEEWFNHMSQSSKNAKLRLYLSDPAKLGPSGWEYNLKTGGLFHATYNNYFRDMLAYFRKTRLTCKEMFK